MGSGLPAHASGTEADRALHQRSHFSDVLLALVVGSLRLVLPCIARFVRRSVAHNAVDDGRCCDVSGALQNPACHRSG